MLVTCSQFEGMSCVVLHNHESSCPLVSSVHVLVFCIGSKLVNEFSFYRQDKNIMYIDKILCAYVLHFEAEKSRGISLHGTHDCTHVPIP